MTSVWWLRWVFVAISVVVAVLFINRHQVLFGILILAMTLVRAAILVGMRSRRNALRARRRARFGRQ